MPPAQNASEWFAMLNLRSPELNAVAALRQLTNSNYLKRGRRGPEIAVAQKALDRLGYDMTHSESVPGVFDGVFGGGTESTVKLFQNHQLIVDDGLIGPTTIGRVDIDLASLPFPTASELDDTFKIMGSSQPANLKQGHIWRPSSYVQAVREQMESLFKTGTVPRVVFHAFGPMPRKIRVIPEGDLAKADARFKPAGAGQPPRLFFTPGKYVPGSPSYLGPGFKAGMTLLHEIFHAMRDSNGKYTSDQEVAGLHPATHPPGAETGSAKAADRKFWFKNRGEFLAITVVNIFRSELNQEPLGNGRVVRFLRKDHGSSFEFQKMASPELFHKNPEFRIHLKKLKTEQSGLFFRLAKVDAPFNPIRDFG